jgi:heme oxygenase (mycobilin-producing)
MITTANRIFVAPEFAEQFENNFRNRARMVDGMPGFVSNQLLRPVNVGDPYIVFTVWESREHFEAWVRSPEFKMGHARSGTLPKEAFSGPNKLELHEIILDTTRPDLEAEPHGTPFSIHE